MQMLACTCVNNCVYYCLVNTTGSPIKRWELLLKPTQRTIIPARFGTNLNDFFQQCEMIRWCNSDMCYCDRRQTDSVRRQVPLFDPKVGSAIMCFIHCGIPLTEHTLFCNPNIQLHKSDPPPTFFH